MKDKKIRYNGDELSTSCFPQQIPNDIVNPWRNEVWTAKSFDGTTIYHKSKTWENCWVKYKLVIMPEREDERNGMNGEYLYINYKENDTRPYAQFKFPLITNLQDYIERGGSLAHAITYAHDKNALIDELYRVTPLVEWGKHPNTFNVHKSWYFLGSQWFTHAWNAKGVNLGARGWRDHWVFNFTKNPNGEPTGIHGLSLPFFLCGSNMSNIEFRFGPNVRIGNAQGMFKALQVGLNLKISNLDGQPLESTASQGFSPYVISELFKQTGANIVKTPSNINYQNVHSASQMVYETWGLTELSSFNNLPLGSETKENTLSFNFPPLNYMEHSQMHLEYPSFGRNSQQELAGANGLQKIGPLLDMRYANNTNVFLNSPNITSVRIKNLNYGHWNFNQQKKMDEESVKYMLRNVWDRQKGFDELKKVEGQDRLTIRLTKNRVLVQDQERKTITCPAEWDAFITQDLINLVIDRGWNLNVGGVDKQKASLHTDMSFTNGQGNGYTIDTARKTITIDNLCVINRNTPSNFEVRIPFTGDYNMFTLENGTTDRGVQIRREGNMIIINVICEFIEAVGKVIAKLLGMNGDSWDITLGNKKDEPKVRVRVTPSEGIEEYTINNNTYSGVQDIDLPQGVELEVTAQAKYGYRFNPIRQTFNSQTGLTLTPEKLKTYEITVQMSEGVESYGVTNYKGPENNQSFNVTKTFEVVEGDSFSALASLLEGYEAAAISSTHADIERAYANLTLGFDVERINVPVTFNYNDYDGFLYVANEKGVIDDYNPVYPDQAIEVPFGSTLRVGYKIEQDTTRVLDGITEMEEVTPKSNEVGVFKHYKILVNKTTPYNLTVNSTKAKAIYNIKEESLNRDVIHLLDSNLSVNNTIDLETIKPVGYTIWRVTAEPTDGAEINGTEVTLKKEGTTLSVLIEEVEKVHPLRVNYDDTMGDVEIEILD